MTLSIPVTDEQLVTSMGSGLVSLLLLVLVVVLVVEDDDASLSLLHDSVTPSAAVTMKILR